MWPVFEDYRLNLSLQGGKEMDDAYRAAAALLAEDRGGLTYTAAIVDEAQDMGAQAYRLIRALVPEGPNDLFIVGDGHQRIYGRSRVVLGQCGIRIVGRSHKLRLNYRTTEETRSWAVRLLDGREIDDLDGGLDDHKGFKSLTHGPLPQVIVFDSAEQQAGIRRPVAGRVGREWQETAEHMHRGADPGGARFHWEGDREVRFVLRRPRTGPSRRRWR